VFAALPVYLGVVYPSAGGGGERAAWFRDSEGNLLGLGQAIPSPQAGD
jgi:hypothetical protein